MSVASSKKVITINSDHGAKMQKHLFDVDAGGLGDDSFDDESYDSYDESVDADAESTMHSPTASVRIDLGSMTKAGGGPMDAPTPSPQSPSPQPPPKREFVDLPWLESHDIMFNVLKHFLVSTETRGEAPEKRVNIVDAIVELSTHLKALVTDINTPVSLNTGITPPEPTPAVQPPTSEVQLPPTLPPPTA